MEASKHRNDADYTACQSSDRGRGREGGREGGEGGQAIRLYRGERGRERCMPAHRKSSKDKRKGNGGDRAISAATEQGRENRSALVPFMHDHTGRIMYDGQLRILNNEVKNEISRGEERGKRTKENNSEEWQPAI